jgi:hypothetical protein
MKSSYELAMERLQQADPEGSKPLSDEQKQQLADIDTRYKAKVAERELFLNKLLAEATAKRDREAVEQLTTQLRSERSRLQGEMEAAKEKVRNAT